jgi:glycosyltransferase involved in cell wall biosynthesis
MSFSEMTHAQSTKGSPNAWVDAGGDRVLIIVPAFNEAQSLPGLIRALHAEYPGCDVVVIDDGSTDGTREAVASLARVVSLPCNLGIGGAVQTGLQIALREGYDLAVQVDGDGQHPPQEIAKLIAALRKLSCDMVVGTRFRGVGGFQSTAARRIGIRFFASIVSGICGTEITDATSGFRAMNRRAIQLLARRYSEDYPEVEALVVAHLAGLRIAEIPVRMSERSAGRSSIGSLKSLIYMVKVPLAIFMNLLRRNEPQHL